MTTFFNIFAGRRIRSPAPRSLARARRRERRAPLALVAAAASGGGGRVQPPVDIAGRRLLRLVCGERRETGMEGSDGCWSGLERSRIEGLRQDLVSTSNPCRGSRCIAVRGWVKRVLKERRMA